VCYRGTIQVFQAGEGCGVLLYEQINTHPHGSGKLGGGGGGSGLDAC
jgi:hypothetical protein